MAMLQKEETLLKNLSKAQQSNFSSFVNKYNQKPTSPTTNITRTKSNSIPTKTLVLINPATSPPKSPKSSSPSPTNMNRQVHNTTQFDRLINVKSPTSLKDTKKSPLKVVSPTQKKETVQAAETPDSCSDMGLDRYTFYSSGFSLFDAKSPTAKSSTENAEQGLSPVNIRKTQDTLQLEVKMKTEPDDEAIEKRVLASSKSCKFHELATPDAKTGFNENIKASLTSPKTTKNVPSSPITISYKFVDTFSSRVNKKVVDRNFSPKGKPQQTLKSVIATQQQLPIQTYYLPNKKNTNLNMGIKRSISPEKDKDKTPQKDNKIASYICKNPFLQPSSPDYGKYDKLFKGIQSRGLGKFTAENYKKLGKSYTAEVSSRTLRENRLMTPKSSLKGNTLTQNNSQREIQSFCAGGSCNKTVNEEQVKGTGQKVSPTDKTTNDENGEHSDHIESITSTISGVQTDNNIMTCTSVEQGGDVEANNKAKSGRRCDSPGSKEEFMARKRDSWIGKQHKETFEEFFSGAMSYMCEVIVSREMKSSKFEERPHEEHLDMLLDHIISESMVLKQGIQKLPERVKIGKSLLILLEMMLRSVLYLVRKDSTIKSTSRNKSTERISGKKDRSSRQEYNELRFEEICGLTGKEGRCDESERNVRDNLCFEIQKRREELDVVEKELKEGNQGKMLQYVQNIQVKISKVLREKRK